MKKDNTNPEPIKTSQRQHLIDLMKTDQENGMYEPVKSETVEILLNFCEYLNKKRGVLKSMFTNEAIVNDFLKLSTPTPEPEK